MKVNIHFEARVYTEDGHLRLIGRITHTPYPGTLETPPDPLEFEIWRVESFRDGFLHATFFDDDALDALAEEHYDTILLQAEEAYFATLTYHEDTIS